ncbi:hypothetical protein [Pseudomaricurvus sp. HS19]|uniref:hypothetical protein n=1 Tax=Pseudomaricurvus sp. HS19 TaxID=2692626 RepID=UPI00136AEF51|nr:hypothetical protein [Pseudomaricurvus sp. HS19]MYM62954.1 hypothetical protein [Pseudomaricurvus sp. HS19]
MSKAITNAAAVLTQHDRKGKLPPGPSLDITFMLTYKADNPGFTGMRMGGYTEQENTLYFERAVPEDLLESSRAGEFVSLVLEDMFDNATDYFADRGRLFNPAGWKESLRQVGIAR